MFDVGFPELVLIAVIGLLVLGPQRLPKVAAEIGKWVGRARRTATQLRRQLEREIELSELQTPEVPPKPPPPAGPAPPSSGEVPPGPGTHADTPDADHSIGGPAETTEPLAGSESREQPGVVSGTGSQDGVDSGDKTRH